MNLKKIMKLALTTLVMSGFFSNMAHAAEPINTTWIGNLAVEGYDTVAYFTENKPVKGKKEFQIEWQGANWRFSSEEHLDLFVANPEKYAPQYGGYCAWAVSNNALAGIDPSQFTILDDKLYLNYNATVQNKWFPEKEKRIELADQFFPGLVDQAED